MTTFWVGADTMLPSFVTHSVTVYDCGSANVCDTTAAATVLALPSPKSQRYCVIVPLPLGHLSVALSGGPAQLAEASNWTGELAAGEVGVNVNCAVGTRTGG